jgi:hypothetical protein
LAFKSHLLIKIKKDHTWTFWYNSKGALPFPWELSYQAKPFSWAFFPEPHVMKITGIFSFLKYKLQTYECEIHKHL